MGSLLAGVKILTLSCALLLLCSLNLTACSLTPPDVSGFYTGSYAYLGRSASLTINIQQNSGNLSGTISASGATPNFGDFTGSVDNNGNITMTSGPNNFSGTFASGTINGTWTDNSADLSGTFSVSK